MMSVSKAEVSGNTFEADERYRHEFRTQAGYFFTDKSSPAAAFLHCGEVKVENNAGFGSCDFSGKSEEYGEKS